MSAFETRSKLLPPLEDEADLALYLSSGKAASASDIITRAKELNRKGKLDLQTAALAREAQGTRTAFLAIYNRTRHFGDVQCVSVARQMHKATGGVDAETQSAVDAVNQRRSLLGLPALSISPAK